MLGAGREEVTARFAFFKVLRTRHVVIDVGGHGPHIADVLDTESVESGAVEPDAGALISRHAIQARVSELVPFAHRWGAGKLATIETGAEAGWPSARSTIRSIRTPAQSRRLVWTTYRPVGIFHLWIAESHHC